MSGRHPPLTSHRRLGPGAVLRTGVAAAYRAVQIIEGEPHLVRDEFGVPGPAAAGGRPLLCLAHVTDLQLADVQSPTRFEFLNRLFADPRYAQIVPVQRPQEALTSRAVDATVRTLNAVRGPATGASPHLVVTTGDAIDNAQWNELQIFLALFDGGMAAPDPAGPATRACNRSTGLMTSSGSRTAQARTGPTSSGASSASRTTLDCCSSRSASSARTGW